MIIPCTQEANFPISVFVLCSFKLFTDKSPGSGRKLVSSLFLSAERWNILKIQPQPWAWKAYFLNTTIHWFFQKCDNTTAPNQLSPSMMDSLVLSPLVDREDTHDNSASTVCSSDCRRFSWGFFRVFFLLLLFLFLWQMQKKKHLCCLCFHMAICVFSRTLHC